MGASIQAWLLIVIAVGSSICASPAAAKPQTEASAAATAQTLARSANKALEEGHVREANRLFDQALAVIGTGYQRPGLIDDTGFRLVLAQAEARRGHLIAAAHLKARVVQARIEVMWQQLS